MARKPKGEAAVAAPEAPKPHVVSEGELSYSYTDEFVFEQWIKAQRPKTMQLLCSYGYLSRATLDKLLKYGLRITTYEYTPKGVVYGIEANIK